MTKRPAAAAKADDAPLARYNAKRDFSATAEPQRRVGRRKAKSLAFIVQKR